MQMYINHFGVWWPISCGPLNNHNVLTKGKGLDVRSIWPSPGPLHGHDSFLKRVNRPKKIINPPYPNTSTHACYQTRGAISLIST